MGGGGNNTDIMQAIAPYMNPYNENTAGLNTWSKQLWKGTKGMRGTLNDQFSQFLSGGNIPEAYSPVYVAHKNAIERQYNVGRENLLANTPTGGTMGNAFANLEGQRAGSLADAYGNIAQDMYNKTYGYATQIAPTQALGGLGVAGSQQNQMDLGQLQAALQAAGMQAQQDQMDESNKLGGMGGLGSGLGQMLGKTMVSGGMLGGGKV